MTTRVHAKKLLMEGKKDKRVVPELVEANGIPWLLAGTDQPIVHIEEFGGISNLLTPGVIEAELKATGLTELGIVADANGNAQSTYTRIRARCLQSFPALATNPIAGGQISTNSDVLKIGIWLMPDNQSRGMLETFLTFLCTDPNDQVLSFADQSCRSAKAIGATFNESHFDKAKIHTWLAWQDEPGRQLHEAVKHKVLHAGSTYAQPFINWFRTLFSV